MNKGVENLNFLYAICISESKNMRYLQIFSFLKLKWHILNKKQYDIQLRVKIKGLKYYFLFQRDQEIYFSVTKDLLPGSELKVWYSPHYAKIMNVAPLRSDSYLVEPDMLIEVRKHLNFIVKDSAFCLVFLLGSGFQSSFCLSAITHTHSSFTIQSQVLIQMVWYRNLCR